MKSTKKVKTTILMGLKKAVEEMNLIKQGKLKGIPARDLFKN